MADDLTNKTYSFYTIVSNLDACGESKDWMKELNPKRAKEYWEKCPDSEWFVWLINQLSWSRADVFRVLRWSWAEYCKTHPIEAEPDLQTRRVAECILNLETLTKESLTSPKLYWDTCHYDGYAYVKMAYYVIFNASGFMSDLIERPDQETNQDWLALVLEAHGWHQRVGETQEGEWLVKLRELFPWEMLERKLYDLACGWDESNPEWREFT